MPSLNEKYQPKRNLGLFLLIGLILVFLAFGVPDRGEFGCGGDIGPPTPDGTEELGQKSRAATGTLGPTLSFGDPANATGNRFGYALAFHENNTLIVGAPWEQPEDLAKGSETNESPDRRGSIYRVRYDFTQWPWQNTRNPADVTGKDGINATDVRNIVGRLAGRSEEKLPDPPTADDAPPPYYDVNGDGWVNLDDHRLVMAVVDGLRHPPQAGVEFTKFENPEPKDPDNFFGETIISLETGQLVVGSSGRTRNNLPETGTVYVLGLDTNLTIYHRLFSSSTFRNTKDHFGRHLAPVTGSHFLIGCPECDSGNQKDRGWAGLYGIKGESSQESKDQWGQLTKGFRDKVFKTLEDDFGVGLSGRNNFLVVGAPKAAMSKGRVFLFENNPNDTTQPNEHFLHIDNPNVDDTNFFGTSITMKENIVVAADDALFVFDGSASNLLSKNPNTEPLLTIKNPNEDSSDEDRFGHQVQWFGKNILASAPGKKLAEKNLAGTVYLFDSTTGDVLLTLDHPDPTTNAQFGRSMAVQDGVLAIGAPHIIDWDDQEDKTATPGRGMVYMYSLEKPRPDDAVATTKEDTAVEIKVTAMDPRGGAVTYSLTGAPDHGALEGTLPDVTYRPDTHYNGTDSFKFTASNDKHTSSEAVVTITITPEPDPPVANNGTASTDEDNKVTLTLRGSDPDGDKLTFRIVGGPSSGTLTSLNSPTNTTVTTDYIPNENYNGKDSFTFLVTDGTHTSNEETVNLTIKPINDKPVAIDQPDKQTEEDTPKGITLAGSDVDGNTLTYKVTRAPTNGSTSGQPPNIRYTPGPNFTGTDHIVFKVNDGSLDSDEAMVTITVTAVNDPPVADGQSASAKEDIPKKITLTGSDPENEKLTYTIVDNPTKGSLKKNLNDTPPTVTYAPGDNKNGQDSFTFKVTDGTNDSAKATVTITVKAINDPPAATDQQVNANEDAPKSVTLAGTDIDGDPLSYKVATQPTHGTLSGKAPNLTYAPNDNYNGNDSFTFAASDETLTSKPATVSITVTPVNDAPVANTQEIELQEDASKGITLTGSDLDGDPLTYNVVEGGAPKYGTLSGDAPNLTYTPKTDFNGDDHVTFTTNDKKLTSKAATVSIKVTAVNDPPVANSQDLVLDEDKTHEITLTASDVDGDKLIFSKVVGPKNGTLSKITRLKKTTATVTYVPYKNFTGSDSFSFMAKDGTESSKEATISIEVKDLNDKPFAKTQEVTTKEDTAIEFTLVGSDPEDADLTFFVLEKPSNGAISEVTKINATSSILTYTPTTNYNGNDNFTFKVNDGEDDSAPGEVSISIKPVNDAPAAAKQSVTTEEEVATEITLKGSDIDGDSLTFEVTDKPSNGTISGKSPTFTYRPNKDYSGTDSFKFVANDDEFDSKPETVSVQITGINDPPVAESQSVSTNEDSTVSILLNGSDADKDTLSYIITKQPAHGRLSGSKSQRTYRPDANYDGKDFFSFKVNDGQVDSSEEKVTLMINPVNDRPVASNPRVTTNEDTAAIVTLKGTDIEGDTLTVELTSQPSHGKLTGRAPVLTYRPEPNYNGKDQFKFSVNDGNLKSSSDSGIVRITVNGVNDPPIATAQSKETIEDESLKVTLSGTDIDGNQLSYLIVSAPNHGSLSGTNEARTYVPNQDFFGWDYFTFSVDDNRLTSAPVRVSILVKAVNDPPGEPKIVDPYDGREITEAQPKLVVGNVVDVDNDPVKYQFEIFGSPSTDGQPLYTSGYLPQGSGPTTSWKIYTALSDNTSYWWRVVAVDPTLTSGTSSTVSFFVNRFNDAPSAPVLTFPGDESEIRTLEPTLKIENSHDVDGDVLAYGFELDSTKSFSSFDLQTSGTIPGQSENTPEWKPKPLQEDTWYYWRARARDKEEYSPWATGQFFVNQANGPPTAPQVLKPRDGVQTKTTRPTLVVRRALDPERSEIHYHFEVYSGSVNGRLVYEHQDPTAENIHLENSQVILQVDQELPAGKLFWRARAVDTEGLAGSWSEPGEFEIEGDSGGFFSCDLSPQTFETDPLTPRSLWYLLMILSLLLTWRSTSRHTH